MLLLIRRRPAGPLQAIPEGIAWSRPPAETGQRLLGGELSPDDVDEPTPPGVDPVTQGEPGVPADRTGLDLKVNGPDLRVDSVRRLDGGPVGG
ncbi:hypothetical protein [Nonomuraea sp. NPDC049480]|uniref:hypothetical protein n=1 Tax=Nonomuraea sp. NPDC049480 TaxID=3364353 RepID=UPI003788841C